jgi:hypothetical protein
MSLAGLGEGGESCMQREMLVSQFSFAEVIL